jgi:hypothetical protein
MSNYYFSFGGGWGCWFFFFKFSFGGGGVLNVFQWSSQWVPNMFPIAPHFIPLTFALSSSISCNLYKQPKGGMEITMYLIWGLIFIFCVVLGQSKMIGPPPLGWGACCLTSQGVTINRTSVEHGEFMRLEVHRIMNWDLQSLQGVLKVQPSFKLGTTRYPGWTSNPCW